MDAPAALRDVVLEQACQALEKRLHAIVGGFGCAQIDRRGPHALDRVHEFAPAARRRPDHQHIGLWQIVAARERERRSWRRHRPRSPHLCGGRLKFLRCNSRQTPRAPIDHFEIWLRRGDFGDRHFRLAEIHPLDRERRLAAKGAGLDLKRHVEMRVRQIVLRAAPPDQLLGVARPDRRPSLRDARLCGRRCDRVPR